MASSQQLERPFGGEDDDLLSSRSEPNNLLRLIKAADPYWIRLCLLPVVTARRAAPLPHVHRLWTGAAAITVIEFWLE